MASDKNPNSGKPGTVVELKKPDVTQPGATPPKTDTESNAKDDDKTDPKPSNSTDGAAPTTDAQTNVKDNNEQDKQPPRKTGPVKALRIRAKGERFRRCGRTFGRDETVIPLADLDKAEIATLKGEPSLVVEEVEI